MWFKSKNCNEYKKLCGYNVRTFGNIIEYKISKGYERIKQEYKKLAMFLLPF